MSKKNLLIAFIIILLSLLWFLVPVTSCSAAEPEKVYTITATELTNLEVELNRASKAIQNCKSNSEVLKAQLTKSQEALTQAQVQLATLKEQLAQSQVILKQQQTQLQNANQSLTELSVEMKEQQRSLERQRNIAYIIAAGLLYVAVK